MATAPDLSRFSGPGVARLAEAIASGRPLRAALPRSTLHIKFLLDNEAPVDLCLVRDDHMLAPAVAAFGENVVHLGREVRIGGGNRNLLSVRRANARYYADLAALAAAARFEKLVVFLATEPLEEFLVPRLPPGKVEIWEDGLMHYVDMEGPLFRVKRRLVQKLCGFHVGRLSRTTLDKNAFRIRDRFREGSLAFHRPLRTRTYRAEILFVGQPLVGDGLVDMKTYATGLRALASALPHPIRYLPHPRESADAVDTLRAAAELRAIEQDRRGVLEHCADFAYLAYLSPFSTALLDLAEADRSFFVAGLVGLDKLGLRLRGFSDSPVAVPATREALAAQLARLGPPLLNT
jgi:hypothetical protein